MPLNKKIVAALLVLIISINFNSYSQTPTINGTGTSTETCGTCAPSQWFNTGGTPDISDRNYAGGQGTLGAQASWIINGQVGQLPLPPNLDVRWITMRDVGDFNTQIPENVTTQIDGLIVGKLYKITYFVMSAFSNNDGGANITTPGTGSDYYGGSYMDNFDYQLTNQDGSVVLPSVNIVITDDYEERWVTASIIFVANDTSMQLTIFPGDDAVTNNNPINFEILHFAVDDINAIERIDTDGDGIFDDEDIDDDNDGILDTEEYGITISPNEDTDNDGIPNYLETDYQDGGSGPIIDFDFDNDGIPNHLDLDSDNDGILDNVEAQVFGNGFITFTSTDSDGDGLVDVYDATPNGNSNGSGSNGLSPLNSDNNNNDNPDYLDIDSDDDGIPDNVEAQTTLGYISPTDQALINDEFVGVGINGVDAKYENFDTFSPIALNQVDTDNDGTPDYRDTDSDNDGLTDIEENNEGNTPGTGDTDGDGLLNNFDDDNSTYDVNDDINTPSSDLPDADGDVNTGGDVDYRDGVTGLDTDRDGIPDTVDIDDDDDGILDVNECTNQQTSDTFVTTVTLDQSVGQQNNIIGDTPTTSARLNNINDALGVGFASVVPSGTTLSIRIGKNNNNNKVVRIEQADASGNALTINNELLITATTSPTEYQYTLTTNTQYLRISMQTEQGNGRAEVYRITVPGGTVCNDFDTDGDGIVDRLDIDSDNDGIPDNYEAQTTTGFTPRSGVDADNDGLDDAYDEDITPGETDIPLLSDGINPTEWPNTDGSLTNSDTIPDYLDIDADNDGIPDNIEAQSTTGYMPPNGVPGANGLDSAYDFTDAFTSQGLGFNIINTDGDAQPDFRDTDSDGDNTDDDNEGLTGTPTFSGTDTDNDGLDNAFENGSTIDGFIVNDGNNDPAASGFIDVDTDVNTGGDLDYRDTLVGQDTDGDGIIDSIDIDDDNDGILDTVEGEVADFDGDGIPNSLDMDSDGDGILDNVEAQTAAGFVAPPTTGIAAAVGANGLFSIYENNDTPSATGLTPNVTSAVDTTPDYLDIDADDDGIPDNVEFQTTIGYNPPTGNVGLNGVDSAYENNDSFTAIGGTPVNTDTVLNNNADDFPDYRDIDSDGDAFPDTVESGITDNGGGTADADGDGLLDRWEGSDATAGEAYDVNDEIDDPVNDLEDVDGDGNSTGDVDYRDINITIDTDKDGVPDNIDIDDDNDGLLDINEGSGANNPIGDEDGDGLLNFEDNSDGGNGGDGSTTNYTDTNADGIPDVFDADNDGIPNHLDIDADNDGIPDNVEIQPTLGYIGPSGLGNGITDADGDGLDDNYDSNTSDTSTGASIGVATPENTDSTFANSDSIPDYIDTDSDGDGTPDIQENGNANAPGATDTDGDGLFDAFEGISNTDDFDVNDEINTPSTDLPDVDGDVNTTGNVDYRDENDVIPEPPVSPGLELWLRADIDVTGVATVTSWLDQSGNSFNATNTGNGPNKLGDGTATDGLNFNPVINFQESNSEYLEIVDGILGNNVVYDNLWVYAVSASNSTTNASNIFSHEIAGAADLNLQVPTTGNNISFNTATGTTLSVGSGSAASTFNVWTAGYANTLATPSGDDKTVYRDGFILGDNNGGTTFTSDNNSLFVGSAAPAGTFYDGRIAELLVYTSVPSAVEQQQIESYLAIKYGITLSNTGGNTGVNAGDYILQDLTTTVWDEDANSTYHNDVAGIGRDDNMVLNQKQSKSINSDALVTIGRGTIAANNASNNNSINSNKSFLMWGNNNAPVNNVNTTVRTLICEDALQLDRVWKVVETGSMGVTEVAAPVTIINNALFNSPTTSETVFFLVADNDSFTTNVQFIPTTVRTINGTDEYVVNYNFNGTKYFTYTEELGIFWNGDSNAWSGGAGANGAPSTNALDENKVLVIDAETSGTNAFMTESAVVECVWVKANSKLIIGSDLFLEFDEDFILDGEIRMVDDAQLLQTHTGPSNVQGNGKIYRDQAALVPSIYRYHYWSSPVTAALGNTTFRVTDVMKDGTTPTSENSIPKDITWLGGPYNPNDISNLNGAPTDPITISSFWIYTYLNGTTRDDWVQERETGIIPIAEGYIMKSTGRSPQNFTFVGSPNDGTYTKTLTAGTTSLLGNPYPSVLNTAAFIADNIDVIDGTLYYWEHQGESSTTTKVEGHFEFGYIGGYSQRNQAMGVAANSVVVETAGLGDGTYTAPPQFVSVAQSFFVSVPGNKGGTVNFENSHRAASTNNTFLRNSGENLEDIPNIKIGMDYITDTNAEIHRQLGVNFKQGNTFDYDPGYDSGIFDLQPTDMFWDFKELETNLVIAGVDKLSAELQVPIGFNIDSDFPVKVMLDETNNIDKSVDIFLVDLVTGRFYNLENPVELDLPKGNYTDRFILTFSGEALSTNNPLLKGLNAFVNNGSKEIVIRNNDNNTIKSVEVFNIVGQKINQWRNIENTYENTFDINHLSSGIYIIRIQTENGFKTQKVVVE